MNNVIVFFKDMFLKNDLTSYNQWQKFWEKLLLDNFVFPFPSPSSQCWGLMNEACVKQCYGFPTFYRGRGAILDTLLKIPIIFCYWLSEIYKIKKKDEVRCMPFQITQICFNESYYATLHSLIRIMTENGAKITQKLSQ